ncbi:hypothetical protein AMAG_17772 [Allomyces macrogynus ATCC 38327]|uniref:Uncharacterized protein n=1 Tax=Allomyces macrogynus (strain ATCC 38327) TaxID=578462 RepID=A0A0L0RZ08_ALLM3|nr:hypothetical protein AMAG_17772 [Allomyces macrogynus ATCC 38327]|eukprot:KNE55316.1 hypothetical protein AMAG_17772 [Allomyces macrogynus ATCC 38327]
MSAACPPACARTSTSQLGARFRAVPESLRPRACCVPASSRPSRRAEGHRCCQLHRAPRSDQQHSQHLHPSALIGHFASCSKKMAEAGEIIKWTSFAVCIVVAALFLWLFRQRHDQAMDLLEVYSRQVLDTERRTQAMLQEVMAQRHVRYEEDTIDPLPKYTIHAAADEPHIDLADLESRLAVIVQELESGAIVVTAEEPVMAMSPASSAAGSAPGSPRLGPSNARSAPRRRPDSGTATPPMRSGAATPPVRSGTSTPPLRSGTQSPLMSMRFQHVLGRRSPHHSRQPSATSMRGASAPGFTTSPRASDESDDIQPHPHLPGDEDVLAAISGHPPSQTTRGRTLSPPSSPVHEHAHTSNRHSWISAVWPLSRSSSPGRAASQDGDEANHHHHHAHHHHHSHHHHCTDPHVQPVHLTLSLPPPPDYDAALAAPPALSAIPEDVQDVEVDVPSPIPCSQDVPVAGDAMSVTSACMWVPSTPTLAPPPEVAAVDALEPRPVERIERSVEIDMSDIAAAPGESCRREPVS